MIIAKCVNFLITFCMFVSCMDIFCIYIYFIIFTHHTKMDFVVEKCWSQRTVLDSVFIFNIVKFTAVSSEQSGSFFFFLLFLF